MTKEDVEKIQSESIHAVELLFSKGPTYPESYCELFERAAAYGHNLAMERMEQYANQKVQELQKENELLEAEVQRLKTKLETLAHLRELREKFKK